MSSRRTEHRPLVVSTEAHAAVEAAFLAAAAAPPKSADPDYQIPDSPAELWTSASRAGITVGPADGGVPAELSQWVAPTLVVRWTTEP
ncbi:hypothetical protein FB566_0966 [Stackebrandtia endophytica]|uniref:Uncharacterized protein n=1 Tax=Stackebrandtia endophytica TaxID=1496996 RepID=A0A543ASA1_9ACTN|nr:hypothetical protein [Stackebrandtia endophytica]TQL75461.1 hypothetical protein FB566_0966 [Stackebrandtia endophytica]